MSESGIERVEGQLVEEGTALAVIEDSHALATPAVTPEEAKAAMAQYLELCEAVLEKSDYQEFTQKVRRQVEGRWVTVTERKAFKKKSAVKKLQTFFGVEVELKGGAIRDDLGEGHYGFCVIATARARNGRVVEATGACATTEERFDIEPYDNETDAAFARRRKKALARAYHDILSTAETRATNRAVMNCIGVGGGEVTADEVQRERIPANPPPPQPPPPKPRQHPDPATTADADEFARKEGLKNIHIYCDTHGIETKGDDSHYRRMLKHEFAEYFEDPDVQVSAAHLSLPDLRRFSLMLQDYRKSRDAARERGEA